MPTIKNRRATRDQWEINNPVLASGEMGYEIDTNKHKIGNGFSTWSELRYFIDEEASDFLYVPNEIVETGRLSEAALDAKFGNETHVSKFTSTAWKNALFRRQEKTVRLLVLSDSRAEGPTPNASIEGVTDWGKNWPNVLTEQLRSEYRMPVGGRGFIPVTHTDPDENYRYSVSSFISGARTPVVGETGVTGSTYMVGNKLRIPLRPGTSSVDVISHKVPAGDHGLNVTTESRGVVEQFSHNELPADAMIIDRVLSPGDYIDVEVWYNGWNLLGVVENVDDEDGGFQVMNLATSGIGSDQVAVSLTKNAMRELISWWSPSISILSLGANDIGRLSATTTVDNLTTISNTLTTLVPKTMTLVTTVPAALSNPYGAPMPPEELWDSLNEAIRNSNHRVLDLSSVIQTSESEISTGLFLTDLTHLTDSGNVAFSDLVRGQLDLG